MSSFRVSARALRPGWHVYLIYALALLSLLFAIASFIVSHRLNQADTAALQQAQTRQWLAERIHSLATTRGNTGQLQSLVSQYEDLGQGLPGSNSVTTSVAVVNDTAADRQKGSDSGSPVADNNDAVQRDVARSWQAYREVLPGFATDTAPDAPLDESDFATLSDLSAALVTWLNEADAPGSQIESASHLQQLANTVQTRLQSAASSNDRPLRARGPWLVFQQILNRFNVMAESGALTDPDAINLLDEIRAEFTDLDKRFQGSLAALGGADPQPVELERRFATLSSALNAQVSTRQLSLDRQSPWFTAALATALLTLLLHALTALMLWRDATRREASLESSNSRDQASILRLLDEISSLADGDLATQATVTEDMTGAIADSINYAVSELRRLVGSITQSADRVTVAVEETGASARHLADASAVQSREIQRSSTYLKAMADTMGQISERSRESSSIAAQAVESSMLGRQSVSRTIEAIEAIRTRATQTANLLQRLDESTGRISDIVASINAVTERTRLLALNAVIESNSQQGNQRRFSTISDEVQSLASELREAAHDIGTLTVIIQNDARTAMESMEQTINDVDTGCTLADDAGAALQDIDTISRRLSVVVEQLAQKNLRQSEVVGQLSANMQVINEVTRRSAHGMQLSASALDDLKLMATELRDDVADFSLPAGRRLHALPHDPDETALLKAEDIRERAARLSEAGGRPALNDTIDASAQGLRSEVRSRYQPMERGDELD